MNRGSFPILEALILSLALASSTHAPAQTEQVLHTFSPLLHGGNPQASLIMDAAGNLYGTASTGGTVNGGLVFKLTPTASGQWTETILHEFTGGTDGLQPLSGLIFDQAGNLYGTTNTGGSNGYGVVFELSPNANGSWTEQVIHTFTNNSDGAYPQGNLIFDAQGNLYGTTYYGGSSGAGSVYELSPSGHGQWTSQLLYEFTGQADGIYPAAGVVFDGAGNLYGTTYGAPDGVSCTQFCGTVYKLAPSPSGPWSETTLYAFTGNYDGSNPISSLIFDLAGNLYGTASTSGPYQGGVVFKLSPSQLGSWTYSVIYGFESPDAGFSPQAGLVFDAGGNLYGTTFGSGIGPCYNNGCGVVFELSPTSSGVWQSKTLYHFKGNLDGANPLASVILDAADNVYGTTVTGVGTNCTWTGNNPTSLGCGTVYKLSPTSSGQWKEALLYTFPGSDGALPAQLSANAAGNLYGTTIFGGTYGWGDVFQLIKTQGQWTTKTIYSFTGGIDGANPNGVIFDSAGNLYGSTEIGGTLRGCGTVFKLTKNSNGTWRESNLHVFTGGPTSLDGCDPIGNLIFDAAGNLYGATGWGGGASCNGYYGCGTAFELSPVVGGPWKETILHAFPASSTDGNAPSGGLVFDKSGNLYGATFVGGSCTISFGCGTVFEMSPSSNGSWSERPIYNFPAAGNESYFPNSGLIFDAQGNLYGTTPFGGQINNNTGCGEVFELSPSGGIWTSTVLYAFAGPNDGCDPPAGITFDAGGNLFGVTGSGGSSYNCGSVFELTPSAGSWSFNLLHAFAGGTDSCNPNSSVLLVNGKLYGMTQNGGIIGPNGFVGFGTVFEIQP